ncbi:hypothetical protein ACJX0J_007224 [Zea mays]
MIATIVSSTISLGSNEHPLALFSTNLYILLSIITSTYPKIDHAFYCVLTLISFHHHTSHGSPPFSTSGYELERIVKIGMFLLIGINIIQNHLLASSILIYIMGETNRK